MIMNDSYISLRLSNVLPTLSLVSKCALTRVFTHKLNIFIFLISDLIFDQDHQIAALCYRVGISIDRLREYPSHLVEF